MAGSIPSRRQVGRNSSMPDIVVSRSSIRRSGGAGRSPVRQSTTARSRPGSNATTPQSSPSNVRQRLSSAQNQNAPTPDLEDLEDETENASSRRSARGHRSSRLNAGRRGRTPVPQEEPQRSSSRTRSNRRSRSLNARTSRLNNSAKQGQASPAAKASRKNRAQITKEDLNGSSSSVKSERSGSAEFSSETFQVPLSAKESDTKEKKERSVRRGERTKDDSKRTSRTTKIRSVGKARSGSDKNHGSSSSSKNAEAPPSDGAAGNLSKFLTDNSTVSRRKRPSGGARSVGGMSSSRPMTTRLRQGRRSSVAGAMSAERKKEERRHSSSSALDPSETSEASDIDSINDESIAVESLVKSMRNGRELDRGGGSGEFDRDGSREDETKLQLHMSRTDNLLYSVFPKHIAEELRAGRKVEPENHEMVTIFFSDIVGFTDISSNMDAMKICDLLDRLYNSFDALSHYHDVFKVETIGDAYMAVTNLAKEQPDHCRRIAEFSIDAIRVAKQCLIDKDDPSKGFVNIRVGFHSGPVVSNVVGSRNPRYCLFGDTVNTASRMESNSAPNLIHCSDASAELIREQAPDLKLFSRGSITVKGKGDMKTFWVHEGGEKEDDEVPSGKSAKSLFNAFRGKIKNDN